MIINTDQNYSKHEDLIIGASLLLPIIILVIISLA
jgi:hypothetical protein